MNYVDAAVAISECKRVLKPGGYLILQFESADSLEFLGTGMRRNSAQIVWTEYDGQQHRQWVYGRRYIVDILKVNEFLIEKKRFYHILSPLALRLGWSPKKAAYLAKWDKFLGKTPIVHVSESVILSATRAKDSSNF